MKQIIDEETLKIINEELGIADEMRAKSIQIMNWLKPKLPSLMDNAVPTKPGVETNETSGVFRLNNLDTVRIHFNVIFAKNQYCFNDYLKSLPFPYSSYKPETNECRRAIESNGRRQRNMELIRNRNNSVYRQFGS